MVCRGCSLVPKDPYRFQDPCRRQPVGVFSFQRPVRPSCPRISRSTRESRDFPSSPEGAVVSNRDGHPPTIFIYRCEW